MIKIKSEVLTILNKWFDEYFNLYYPLAKETLMFNILKNYEFKVYQTYLIGKKQINAITSLKII